MNHLFHRLAFLLYKKKSITYKTFNVIKDLPIEQYPENVKKLLLSSETEDFIHEEMETADLNKIRIIEYSDKEYPIYIKHLDSMPPVLYLQGNLPFNPNSAAIVGSRKATHYGLKIALLLAQKLTRLGVVVISGLAFGIDTQAHKTCLEADGITYAVLGCGIDVEYPIQNKILRERILKKGSVISEFPLKTPPIKYNFPVRNRIISALSKYVIVVEAGEKSGALITADYALDQGKEVIAIPGNIDQPMSYGTNQLIKSGAVLLDSIDSLDSIFPNTSLMFEYSRNIGYKGNSNLEIETDILKLINERGYSLAELLDKIPYPSSKILQHLSKLEFTGVIKEMKGVFVSLSG